MTKGQIVEIFEKHLIPAIHAEIRNRVHQIEFRLRGLEKMHNIPEIKSFKDAYKNNELYESEKHRRKKST